MFELLFEFLKDLGINALNVCFLFVCCLQGATKSNYIHDDPKYAKLIFAYYGPRNAKVHEALKNYKGFDDEGVKTLVDAGGGKGAALASIVAAHPHIRGINYDLPDFIAQAPQIPGAQ